MNIQNIDIYNEEKEKCIIRLIDYLDTSVENYYTAFQNAAFGLTGKVIIQLYNGLGMDITLSSNPNSHYIIFISQKDLMDFLEKSKNKFGE